MRVAKPRDRQGSGKINIVRYMVMLLLSLAE
jgi:hypothetical protein